MKEKQMNKTIEQLQADLNIWNEKHDVMLASLTYINTEIRLLENELEELRRNNSPFFSAIDMANLLGMKK